MKHPASIALTGLLAATLLAGCASQALAPGSLSDRSQSPSEPPAIAPRDLLVEARAAYERNYEHVAAGRWTDAVEGFAVWLDLHGSADQALTPRATYWIAHSRHKLGQDRLAAEGFRRVVQDWPESAAAGLARRRLASLAGEDQ